MTNRLRLSSRNHATITRTATWQYGYNATGFGGSSVGLALSFSPTFITSYGAPLGPVAIPGAAEITALFDEVMIDRIEIQAVCRVEPSAGTAAFPILWYGFDSTDANTYTLDYVHQMDTCKMWSPTATGAQVLRTTIRPAFQTLVYKTALVSSYAPKRGYVSTASGDVPHYGLKMAGDFTTGPPSGLMTFTARIHFKCRNTN